MSLWIKICGNTSLEDAQLAAEAGADAVGFVFAPSPRRVTAEQVAVIIPRLPVALEKFGVFVDASFEEIESTVRSTGLTGVQLHFNAAPALPPLLRERFGHALRILGVIHFGPEFGLGAQPIADNPYLGDPHIDAVLVDSRTPKAAGGTGTSFDWQAARTTLFKEAAAQKSRLVVAGGLSPENVAAAIATLNPWGVDVVSGVESGPGRKDPAKVRAFIANTRIASRG